MLILPIKIFTLLCKTLLSFIQIFSKFHPKPKVDKQRVPEKQCFLVLRFYVLFYDIACKVVLNYVSRYPNAGNLYDVRDCRVFAAYKCNSGNPI